MHVVGHSETIVGIARAMEDTQAIEHCLLFVRAGSCELFLDRLRLLVGKQIAKVKLPALRVVIKRCIPCDFFSSVGGVDLKGGGVGRHVGYKSSPITLTFSTREQQRSFK